MSETDGNLNDSIAQLWGIAARGRWWIIAFACFIPLAAVAVVVRLPDRYTSDATLVVVQQQVSQRYVDPSITTSNADMLATISREILSRSRLLGVIDSLGLYPKERKELTPERLAERMRKDVVIEPLDQLPGRGDFTSFQISFVAQSPQLAQKVAGRLTSLFIEENLKSRENQASTTTRFLTEQLQAAKQRLDQQERRLSDFKLRNPDGRADQEQGNLEALTDLRIQLQNNAANKSRAQQQHMSLESILDGTLTRLQADRSLLITRFTAKHPDVLKKDGEVEYLRELLSRLRSGSFGFEKSLGSPIPTDPTIAQLKSQVDANLAENDLLAKEEQRLRSDMSQNQGRLRLNPVREQQLASLMRDYELYNQDYTDLLNKQLKSQVTVDLEEQQGGQHFRLIEPPTLPSVPSGPKRLKISLGAVGAGIGLGLALAFLMSLRDRTFYTEKEVRTHFKAPLVVAIPVLQTPSEERRHKWRVAFEWIAACTMFVVTIAAECYVFVHG